MQLLYSWGQIVYATINLGSSIWVSKGMESVWSTCWNLDYPRSWWEAGATLSRMYQDVGLMRLAWLWVSKSTMLSQNTTNTTPDTASTKRSTFQSKQSKIKTPPKISTISEKKCSSISARSRAPPAPNFTTFPLSSRRGHRYPRR